MENDKRNIVHVTRWISRLYHDDVTIDKAVELMRNQNVSPELVKSIYDKASKYANEKIMTDRFHYYTFEKLGLYRQIYYWTSRYMLVSHNPSKSAFHEVKIIDLFNDNSMIVSVERSTEELRYIYPLKNGFGLLEEREDEKSFISLISLDIHQHILKKFHTIGYPIRNTKIVVNKTDPTTFILDSEESTRICKIVDKTIIIDERVDIGFHPRLFYGNFVYALKLLDEYFRRLEMPRLSICNVEKKIKSQFDLEAPAGYDINSNYIECVRDNVFLWLKSDNGMNVIACFNVQTRQWSVFDFSVELSIHSIYGFEEGNIIVRTKEDNFDKHYFYKIQFGKPESLENTVWLSLVKAIKKRKKLENPYEAARKYLPGSSTIICPFENA